MKNLYSKIVCSSATLSLVLTNSLCSQSLTNISSLQRKKAEIDLAGIYAIPIAGSKLSSFTNVTPPAKEETTAIRTELDDEIENWRRAARFARNNPQRFAHLLEMYSHAGELVQLDPDSRDDGIMALSYAVLAIQTDNVLETYYRNNSISSEADLGSISAEVDAIKKAIRKITAPTVAITATGNVRTIATNKTPEPTTTGTGTLGVTYASANNIYSAQFSVASTLDTVKSGYGSYLLAPLNGKSLKSALIEWYHKCDKKENAWLHLYGSFASALWEIQKDTIYKNASNIGLGALYHYKIFEGLIADTEVGLDTEIGLSARWLNGDIRNLLQNDANKARYLNAFPTEKSFFMGIEGGISMNFGQVVGSLQAFYLLSKKDEPIDGLTRLQIAVGLSVRGDVVRGVLGGRNN